MVNGEEPAVLDTDAALIDVLCDGFERALKRGRSPRIEDFLNTVRDDLRPAALRGLLKVEIEVRRARQEPVAPPDYLPRFPELKEVVLGVFHPSEVASATIAHERALPTRANEARVPAPFRRPSDASSGSLEVRCPT